MRCGLCKPVCPILIESNMIETRSPRARMLVARGLLTGMLKPSETLAEIVYTCMTCRYCNLSCPPGVEVDKIVEATRLELVKAKVAPPKAHRWISSNIQKNRNPFGEPIEKRTLWLKKFENISFSKRADVLYWVGCMSSFRTVDTAVSTVEIMLKSDIDFTLLGKDEGCCGSVLIRTGQGNIVEDVLARENVKKIIATEASTVVTACAGCYRTFHEEYPKIVGDLPFEVLHIAQFLKRLIKEGKVKFKKNIGKKATYHDPCHLGRHLNVYEAPRDVIKAIPSLDFIEMAKIRAEARCCGAGGGVRSAFTNLSVRVARDKLLLDTIPTGAEVVVTACPFCVYNLRDAAKKENITIEILDLPEIICEAL